MEANPALERTARVVVLHSDRPEDTRAPVIHSNRNREMEFARRRPQQVPRRCIEVQSIGDPIELSPRRVEGVRSCRHPLPNRRCHRSPLVCGAIYRRQRKEKDRAATCAPARSATLGCASRTRFRNRVAAHWLGKAGANRPRRKSCEFAWFSRDASLSLLNGISS